MTRREIEHAVNILVTEKHVPRKLRRGHVYSLYYTQSGEDETINASLLSLHLFKSLESVVKFLFSEAGLVTYDDLRNNFQNSNESVSDVWDILILKVED
jgi:hypothetical protein